MRFKGRSSRLVAFALTMVVALGLANLFAQATQPLTNADVARMVAAKLGDSVILTAVRTASRKDFDLTVSGLISLKQAGVSDTVIAAMLESAASTPQAAVAPAPPPKRSPIAGTVASAPTPVVATPSSQAAPTPQQPPVARQSYRVDLPTGALSPLEFIKSKTEDAGRGKEFCYIPGEHSPTVIRRGEPLAFAVRQVDSLKNLEIYRKYEGLVKLEVLFVSDKNRRYATGTFVPMHFETYGEVVSGVDPKHVKDFGQSYLYRLREPLAPGEYALTSGAGGMFTNCKTVTSAFTIVE